MSSLTYRCCKCGCKLGDDDFNRADSTNPGPLWHIISGDWEIEDNELVGVGVLATTICHPSAYIHGSYIARMKLAGMAGSSSGYWEIGLGDPLSPAYTVTVSYSSSLGGRATMKIIESGGTVREQQTYQGVGSVDDELKVCWAPGLMVTAALGGRIPALDTCDSSTGQACYADGPFSEIEIGGFSFREGRFDDWTYEVHWLDNPKCQPCSCFCLKSRDDFSCLPKTVTLTFISIGAVDAVLADIPLYQSYPNPSTPWTEKYRWHSLKQSCGAPVGAEYNFRLECGIEVGNMSLIPLGPTYANSPGDQIVFSWETGTDTTWSPRPAIAESSSCSPLSIVFPEIRVLSAFPSPGCDINTYPNGANQPYCTDKNTTCYPNAAPDIRFIPVIVE